MGLCTSRPVMQGHDMLDLNSLRQRCTDGESFEYLYFWGHTPPKSGAINQSCLSHWYAASFEVDGIVYPTAEHWLMAAKARLFSDEITLQKILEAPDPKTAKEMGRAVAHFDTSRWELNCPELAIQGNLAKFGQHSALRHYLLATGDKILVEASPVDRIWGIGLSATDERSRNPLAWEGLNLLGFILMDVRRRLKDN